MPLTPFHWSLAWPIWLWKRERLDFIALSAGAVLPDLPEPLALTMFHSYYWPIRIATHSLIGAMLLMVPVTFALSVWVLPGAFRWLDKRAGQKLTLFAGRDILERPGQKMILFSSLIGVLSHLALDAFTHPHNPLFWPLLWFDQPVEDWWLHILVAVVFMWLFYRYWYKSVARRPQHS